MKKAKSRPIVTAKMKVPKELQWLDDLDLSEKPLLLAFIYDGKLCFGSRDWTTTQSILLINALVNEDAILRKAYQDQDHKYII